MSDDLAALENELRALRPAALDDAFVERLEQCADGSWDFTSPLELGMEHQLRAEAPLALDPNMTERLLAEVMDLPFPESPPKILPFPAKVAAQPANEVTRRGGRWLAAAAAVALMGALAGWFVPQGSRIDAPLAGENSSAAPAPAATPLPSPLTPAGLNRGLSEATDEGVILHGNNRPHRVLKFVYREQVTLKDEQGRTYQVEQPRVEYLIVPAKTD
ncbi:MAG TPA: hypothetical protein VLO11_10045 [Luteolibacter sp.]|nr:hypothetical protein [Luteolibacter sp.]